MVGGLGMAEQGGSWGGRAGWGWWREGGEGRAEDGGRPVREDKRGAGASAWPCLSTAGPADTSWQCLWWSCRHAGALHLTLRQLLTCLPHTCLTVAMPAGCRRRQRQRSPPAVFSWGSSLQGSPRGRGAAELLGSGTFCSSRCSWATISGQPRALSESSASWAFCAAPAAPGAWQARRLRLVAPVAAVQAGADRVDGPPGVGAHGLPACTQQRRVPAAAPSPLTALYYSFSLAPIALYSSIWIGPTPCKTPLQ